MYIIGGIAVVVLLFVVIMINSLIGKKQNLQNCFSFNFIHLIEICQRNTNNQCNDCSTNTYNKTVRNCFRVITS